MKCYESVVIFEPKEEIAKPEIRKFLDILQEFQHEKRVKVEDMGIKRLAYRIKDKYDTGYYAIFYWKGTSENVLELERQFRIDDHVLKFMTVSLEDDNDYLEDLDPKSISKSEQKPGVIDALDVLFGRAKYKTKPKQDSRICSHCGKSMTAGYIINSGDEYYCSDECLHKHYTEEEFLELYDDGNGDSFWTEWESE